MRINKQNLKVFRYSNTWISLLETRVRDLYCPFSETGQASYPGPKKSLGTRLGQDDQASLFALACRLWLAVEKETSHQHHYHHDRIAALLAMLADTRVSTENLNQHACMCMSTSIATNIGVCTIDLVSSHLSCGPQRTKSCIHNIPLEQD